MAYKQQPLKQEEFTMKIIEDLGQTTATADTTRVSRYAIFECTICSTHFKARATGAIARAQTSCIDCTKSESQHYKHPLYAIWNGIRQRCYNTKRKDYYRYGGKGITMDLRWIDNSEAFINWCLANGWTEDCVIDKDIKSRELGVSPATYSPATLSFITQSANTREASGRKIAQLELNGTFIREWDSAIEAAEFVGLKSGDPITNTCKGRAKSSAGYLWKYMENL
jgi:hypothetical protein